MDEVSINIQQLPIAMLEAIASDLNINEHEVLTKVNKYLNSIITPILYKDIIFDYRFDEYANVRDVINNLNEKRSKINTNDPLYEVKVAECDRGWLEVRKEANKFRQKLWSDLEPAIKKHHKFIFGSQCINYKNLIAELECYSNLKRYKFTIYTQECIDQLKSYRGDKFKLMEKLELRINYNFKFEVEDLFFHLLYLKELDTDMTLFHDDLKRFSGFSSNILTSLRVQGSEYFSTEFLYIVHRNFKNLEHLDFDFYEMAWNSSLTELPIFENLLYFTFSLCDNVDPRVLSYMTNPKFWPKLMKLVGSFNDFEELVSIEGQWDGSPRLDACNIDSTNLIQWNNFYQLKSLILNTHFGTETKMLQAIFTNLTNLLFLTLAGNFLSQHFNFLPKNRLLKLSISQLNDFSLTFVNFLKIFVTIKELDLYFTDNAFEGVNLNNLLEEKHKFPKLKEARLDNLPEQLQEWFSYSL